MKNRKIDTIFNQLEAQFDVEHPNKGHENRFLDKLNKQNNTKVIAIKTNYWKPLLSIAASLIILIAIVVPIQQSHGMKDLASVSPQMANTQDFFTSTINEELDKLNDEKSPETEKLIQDALVQIENLEQQYEDLKKDLNTSGNDKRVIYAMISNFQSRIDLLQNILQEIEYIKQLNINNDENSSTI